MGILMKSEKEDRARAAYRLNRVTEKSERSVDAAFGRRTKEEEGKEETATESGNRC